MTTKKKSGGRAPKDASLVDGFNKKPKSTIAKRDPKTGMILPTVGKYVGMSKKQREARNANSKGDLDAAYQMLQDMRYVYQLGGNGHSTGRGRLKELMKSDKEFMGMIKELMKIESALLSARIRKDGSGGGEGGGGFMVILKGLDTDKDIMKMVKDESVDMKQVAHILDPSAGVYEAEEQEKDEALPETPQEG